MTRAWYRSLCNDSPYFSTHQMQFIRSVFAVASFGVLAPLAAASAQTVTDSAKAVTPALRERFSLGAGTAPAGGDIGEFYKGGVAFVGSGEIYPSKGALGLRVDAYGAIHSSNAALERAGVSSNLVVFGTTVGPIVTLGGPDGGFTPYATAGVGIFNGSGTFETSFSNEEFEEWKFGYSAGAGLRIKVGGAHVFGEYRLQNAGFSLKYNNRPIVVGMSFKP